MISGADDRTIVEVQLPQLGETVAEGTLVTWHKSPGDSVDEDEPLCEISTDKVNSDLPSPAEGEVVELVANEGETVEVGSVLARIAVPEPSGASDTEAPEPEGHEPSGTSPPDEERPHFEDSSIALWGGSGVSTGGETGDGDREDAAGNGPRHDDEPRGEDRPRYSPAVRAMARKEGVDLEEIDGSGRGGRITRDDVRRHVEARAEDGGDGTGEGRREEISPVRRVIAERLSESKKEIPHSTTVMEADLSRVAEIRDGKGAAFEKREGVPLTYLPFVAFATLRSLEKHPRMNAVFEGDAIRYRPDVNLGIAVATDRGLVVPVVREADAMAFPDLARTMRDAADGARSGTLEPDDVQGGTFTLTNHGRGGSLLGTPIIVPGQTGILGVGKIRDAAVVVDGEVTVRKQCYLSLSFDHRTVDGAAADAFLRTLVERLASFDPAVVRGDT